MGDEEEERPTVEEHGARVEVLWRGTMLFARVKRLSLVARAPPRLENTSGAAQKISESAARVLLLRNAFGVRTYTEKDDDHN